MREILFRGKTDNKWVYGVPIYLRKEAYIVRDFCLGGSYTDDWVEAETIGQFTGLTDKNGKKIFEGDIIKILPFHSAGLHNEAVAIVCFDRGAFSCKILDHNPASLYMYEKWRVVVLGNIYDNKELLGE